MMCLDPFCMMTADRVLSQLIHTEKCIIKLVNQRNIMSEKLSTLWGNKDGWAERYRFATSLYLL